MLAHKNDPFSYRFEEPHWREDGTCSYCGSITPEEAIRLLKIEGTHYSGSDWKYSWPHKFYIDNKDANPRAIKFYNTHLQDATDEVIAEFCQLSEKYFGITWGRNENGLFYRAIPNIQRWGTVGKITCPRCGCVGGKGVGFCFCPDKCHPDPELPKEETKQ